MPSPDLRTPSIFTDAEVDQLTVAFQPEARAVVRILLQLLAPVELAP